MSTTPRKEFKELFKPVKIGNVLVRNRITMAPMTTLYAGPRGEVTDHLIRYYLARAQGGTGLVIVEAAYVHPLGVQLAGSITIEDDKATTGLAPLADAIKSHGATACLQLIHSGIQAQANLLLYKSA